MGDLELDGALALSTPLELRRQPCFISITSALVEYRDTFGSRAYASIISTFMEYRNELAAMHMPQ